MLSWVRVEDTRFVDESGQEINFCGVNLGEKGKFVPTFEEEDFERIGNWRFNCIRILRHGLLTWNDTWLTE